MESRPLTSSESEARKTTRNEFWATSKLAESMWKQKSRVRWVKLGDKNTRFFQIVANNRFRKSVMGSVKVEDRVVEDPKEIKLEAVRYFQAIFNEDQPYRATLGGVFTRTLPQEIAVMLEQPFEEEEIFAAINGCNNFKAPGPDGFNFSFIKKAWSFMKRDVLDFFKEFHSNARIASGINSSFLTLIPKLDGANSFKEFRPICMVGCIYKILSKVLANRLKPHLNLIIGESQAAFVGDKQILDGALIANEIIHSWKHNNKGGVLLKLDFEKAYDCVNWNFLLDLLSKMGCGEKWCKWMKECIESVSLSVLVNGSPSQEFKSYRGLRQGDPLSPFLFNVVVEALNILFERARNRGLIKGAEIGPNGLIVSHLQFADDTIIFCNNDKEELKYVKRILRCFQLMSGLKINFSKSMVCGVGVEDEVVEEMSEIMGCIKSELPMKYLGLPLGANPRRIKTWQPIVERVKKRLAVWKSRSLSIGGRITLIKSTLSSLPIYYMSLFKIPIAVAKCLEKIQRRFLWGGTDEKRKLHHVKWEVITRPKSAGGLGIKRLLEHNQALLAKWWWRFTKEKDALWNKVITNKYGLSCECANPELPNSRKVSAVWNDICSIGKATSALSEVINQGFRLRVQSRGSIRFWDQIWIGEVSLKQEFPRLFSLSVQKQAKVQEMWQEVGGGTWNLLFRRPLMFVWEEEEVQNLHQKLQGIQIDRSREDFMEWRWSANKCFSVQSAYSEWETRRNQNSWLRLVWKNLCPPKVEVFSWQAMQNKIATRSILISKGIIHIINPGDELCPLCTLDVESPTHLLLHCNFAWKIWSAILRWWNITWACPGSLGDLMLWWFSSNFKNLETFCWEACFYAVLWSIWLARNEITFNNSSMEAEEVLELVKTRMAFWIKGKYDIKDYSVEDFVRCLEGIRRIKV